MIISHKIYGQPGTDRIVAVVSKTPRRRTPAKECEVAMELNCNIEQYRAAIKEYQNGKCIQDAFPFLSATEREFLMTGMTAKEQAAFYGEEE